MNNNLIVNTKNILKLLIKLHTIYQITIELWINICQKLMAVMKNIKYKSFSHQEKVNETKINTFK